MSKRKYKPEEIVRKLRESVILLDEDVTIGEVCRKEYGGLRIEEAHKLKSLDKGSVRLKKLVDDLSLGNAILKQAASGYF